MSDRVRFIDDINEDPLIGDALKADVMRWSEEGEPSGADFERHVTDYHRTLKRRLSFILVCLVVIVLTTGFAVTYGPLDIGFVETYVTIWHRITFNVVDSSLDFIVIDVRMPRIVAGILGGAGLAVCGVVMQCVLRNPLADPYTTGVSSGAAFGATVAITSGLSLMNGGNTVAMAFVFSLIPTLAMIALSRFTSTSPTTMIMAGIGIMYIFNALTTVLMLWSNPEDLASVYQWQVGSLAKVSWDDIPYMAALVIPGSILVFLISQKLNVMSIGDDCAKAMGINAPRMRIVFLALTGLLSAAVVSFTGIIGFVGLVTPHIVRIFIGADNRYLLPASAMFGAMLMIVADLLGRAVLSPTILPVGVMMAFIGGPTFLWLLMRRGNRVW